MSADYGFPAPPEHVWPCSIDPLNAASRLSPFEVAHQIVYCRRCGRALADSTHGITATKPCSRVRITTRSG